MRFATKIGRVRLLFLVSFWALGMPVPTWAGEVSNYLVVREGQSVPVYRTIYKKNCVRMHTKEGGGCGAEMAGYFNDRSDLRVSGTLNFDWEYRALAEDEHRVIPGNDASQKEYLWIKVTYEVGGNLKAGWVYMDGTKLEFAPRVNRGPLIAIPNLDVTPESVAAAEAEFEQGQYQPEPLLAKSPPLAKEPELTKVEWLHKWFESLIPTWGDADESAPVVEDTPPPETVTRIEDLIQPGGQVELGKAEMEGPVTQFPNPPSKPPLPESYLTTQEQEFDNRTHHSSNLAAFCRMRMMWGNLPSLIKNANGIASMALRTMKNMDEIDIYMRCFEKTGLLTSDYTREYRGYLAHASEQFGFPQEMVTCLCFRESQWKQNAYSRSQAKGVCQFLRSAPETITRIIRKKLPDAEIADRVRKIQIWESGDLDAIRKESLDLEGYTYLRRTVEAQALRNDWFHYFNAIAADESLPYKAEVDADPLRTSYVPPVFSYRKGSALPANAIGAATFYLRHMMNLMDVRTYVDTTATALELDNCEKRKKKWVRGNSKLAKSDPASWKRNIDWLDRQIEIAHKAHDTAVSRKKEGRSVVPPDPNGDFMLDFLTSLGGVYLVGEGAGPRAILNTGSFEPEDWIHAIADMKLKQANLQDSQLRFQAQDHMESIRRCLQRGNTDPPVWRTSATTFKTPAKFGCSDEDLKGLAIGR